MRFSKQEYLPYLKLVWTLCIGFCFVIPKITSQAVTSIFENNLKTVCIDSLDRLLILDRDGKLYLRSPQHRIRIEVDEDIVDIQQDQTNIWVIGQTELYQWKPLQKSLTKVRSLEKKSSIYIANNYEIVVKENTISLNDDVCYSRVDGQPSLRSYRYEMLHDQWYGIKQKHLFPVCNRTQEYFLPDSILGLIPFQNKLHVLTTLGLFGLENDYLERIPLALDSLQFPLREVNRSQGTTLIQGQSSWFILTQDLSLEELDLNPDEHWTTKSKNNIDCYYNSERIIIDEKTDRPSIFIDKITLDQKIIATKKNHEFEEATGDLIIQLRSGDWKVDESEFYYQWDGWQEKWISFSLTDPIFLSLEAVQKTRLNIRRIHKENIQTYTNILTIENQSNANPSWWKYIFIGLLLAVGTSIIASIRVRGMQNEMEKLKQQIQLQDALLAEKSKVRQMQMAPHFVYNSLTSIKGLIALGENKKARKYLTDFASLLRSQMRNDAEGLIRVSEEAMLLEKYLSLEKLCHNERFSYQIDVEQGLEDIQIPEMMIQPFAENAVKHGMHTSIPEGFINIRIWKDQQTICCEITDNGIGREAAIKQVSQNHKSVAIDNIKTRLAQFFKFRQIDELLSINDNYQDGKPAGTTVQLTLPIIKSNK